MHALVAKAARATSGFQLPATMSLGTFSRAAGPWTVEWERAHADAQKVLDSIDFSRRDIVIWVPGTDATSVHHDFAQAMRYQFDAESPALVHMQYEASWSLRRSVPTGLATMKLVLEGIRQRLAQRGDAAQHRVLLAGESQGAWIIGEAIADPKVGPVVSRVALMGHPWLAAHHYDRGQDPRVREINHLSDQIAMKVSGDPGVGLDAMIAVRTGVLFQGNNLMTLMKAVLANPIHGVLLLQNQLREIPVLRPILHDPHKYSVEMPRLVNFLRTGVLDTTDEEIDDAKKARKRAEKLVAPLGVTLLPPPPVAAGAPPAGT